MPRENKNKYVIVTAPDGEQVVLGPMRQFADAEPLAKEINAEPDFSAVVPISGTAGMWPSFREAKGGRREEEGGRGR